MKRFLFMLICAVAVSYVTTKLTYSTVTVREGERTIESVFDHRISLIS